MIHNWFVAGGSPDRAENMISLTTRSPRLHEMSSNPLFLTMMCVEYEICGQVPDQAGPMFEYFARSLLDSWDRDRGVKRQLAGQHSLQLKLQILGAIAIHFFEADKRVFHETELLKLIQRELSARNVNSCADALFDEIEKTSGLVVRSRFGNCRFCHPLFQEFFAARHLLAWKEDDEGRRAQTGKLFWDSRYANVLTFYKELLECRDFDAQWR
jgi:predicted NACHT family NTPase